MTMNGSGLDWLLRKEFWRVVMALLVCSSCCSCTVHLKPEFTMTPIQVSQLLHEGVAALRLQNLSAARAAFEVVLERADRKTGRRSTALTRAHAIAYDGLGCVAIAEGNLTLAESYIALARQADAQYLGWMPNLARIRELQGQAVEAQALYRVAVQNYPLKARLRNNFGVFLIKQGDVIEGREQLARGKVVAR